MKEKYFYTVDELEEDKHTKTHSDTYYTTHISANLYDKKNKIVGEVFSINTHYLSNNVTNVTTLTTYITPNGTIVCNWSYTPTNTIYLSGKKETVPTFKDGKYKNKDVKLELEGINDKVRTRELIIKY
jgi:hypothetical protein